MISAPSSSVVTTTTRTAMSIRASLGMVLGVRRSALGWAGLTPNAQRLVASSDLSDQREHRHVHGDDDAADGHAEERDEHRFEKLHQTGDRGVDLFLVEVGDL